jgi:CDP-glycerol glycerophosphotransferase (TagB/SpsB family)
MRSLYLLNQVFQVNASKSFKFRLKRMYMGSINLLGGRLSNMERLRGLATTIRNLLGYSRRNHIQILAFVPFLRNFLRWYFNKRFQGDLLKVQNSEKNFFRNLNCSIIVFPTSGADLLAFELLALSRLENKKNIFVIENWDNLTSKTTFPFNPDYITVMGQKSVKQAQVVHGFDLKNIAVTGLPRFEQYGNSRRFLSSKSDDEKLTRILYLGFSLPYNETRIVNIIFQYLTANYKSTEFEMGYKPHPLRQPRFIEEAINTGGLHGFTGLKVWNEAVSDTKRLPSISEEYISFLSSFDIIITTPTTMALEAMLLRIPIIIDSIDDGIHLTCPSHAMNSYLHLEDLKEIPEVRIAKTENEVLVQLDELMRKGSPYQEYTLNNIINAEEKFSIGLKNLLQSIRL